MKDTFAVAVFPNPGSAYEGLAALRDLNQEGTIRLFGTAMAVTEADGTISTRERTPRELEDTSLGALLGAVVGLLGGPVGAAVGFSAGGLAGTVRGFLHGGESDKLLEKVARAMPAGGSALVAEIAESIPGPVDDRLTALGATVHRANRSDVSDDFIAAAAETQRAELDQRKAARAARRSEASASNLEMEIVETSARLRRSAQKAQSRLLDVQQSMQRQIDALEAQAKEADPSVRRDINRRIVVLREELAEREQKLARALDLAEEALQP
jgi:uncharacterized membrane protein